MTASSRPAADATTREGDAVADLVYDPFDYDQDADPYPTYRRLRDEAPVYRNEAGGFWALSRYDDVVEASVDTEVFSSASGTTLEPPPDLPLLIFTDPPEHTRLRRLVSRAFTPRRVSALEPWIRSLVGSWVDDLAARLDDGDDTVDVVEALALPLPMTVISELLGIPESDRRDVRRWSDAMLHREPGQVAPPASAIEAGTELFVYMDALVRERRDQVDAGADVDDLVSALVRAEVTEDDGSTHRLEHLEALGFCQLLAMAGNETVTKLIANGLVGLDAHADQMDLLVADPSAIRPGVEELLRWDPPSQYQGRTLTSDVTLHGQTMPAGDFVLLITGAACRDERQYDDPDRLDVRRRIDRPVGFGHGPHHCLGAALARLETTVALEELFARLGPVAVDVERCERVHSSNLRGWGRVPIARRA